MDKYNWYSLDNTEVRPRSAKTLGKIFGYVLGVIIYPFGRTLEWVLMFVAAIAETIKNYRGNHNEH